MLCGMPDGATIGLFPAYLCFIGWAMAEEEEEEQQDDDGMAPSTATK